MDQIEKFRNSFLFLIREIVPRLNVGHTIQDSFNHFMSLFKGGHTLKKWKIYSSWAWEKEEKLTQMDKSNGKLKNPTPVVGEVDNTIQWIILSPVDSTVHFVSTDLQDSNLSVG